MEQETVVRLRPVTRLDRYSGDEVPDWDAPPTELPLLTLAPAEPRDSSEQVTDGRRTVTSGWKLYLDVETDVLATDRILVRGVVHQVLGKPAAWGTAGIVVQTQLVEG